MAINGLNDDKQLKIFTVVKPVSNSRCYAVRTNIIFTLGTVVRFTSIISAIWLVIPPTNIALPTTSILGIRVPSICYL